MLHNLGWQSLDSRRQDQRLVLFYKIINGLASVETEDILTPADSRTRKNHSFKFKDLQANCDSYFRYSFIPATISSWNNLPFGIEKVDSVEGFKLKLKEHTVGTVRIPDIQKEHRIRTVNTNREYEQCSGGNCPTTTRQVQDEHTSREFLFMSANSHSFQPYIYQHRLRMSSSESTCIIVYSKG